jgi:DNA-directed RNA polymerase sigma subunit (sigma70/sigma32)
MNYITIILNQANIRQREIQEELNVLRLAEKKENSKLKELEIESRIYENLKLEISISKRYKNINADIEELFSIGLIGLVKAAQKFDE